MDDWFVVEILGGIAGILGFAIAFTRPDLVFGLYAAVVLVFSVGHMRRRKEIADLTEA